MGTGMVYNQPAKLCGQLETNTSLVRGSRSHVTGQRMLDMNVAVSMAGIRQAYCPTLVDPEGTIDEG